MIISISNTLDHIVKTVHQLKTDNPLAPVTIITPNRTVIQSVNRVLLTWGTPVLNVRIETFREHVVRCTESERLNRGQPLFLNDESLLFIREIIDSDDLSYFWPAGEFAGYTILFQQTIQDLRLGLPIDAVSIALDTLGKNGKEIGRIYRKYLVVKGRHLDYADMLELYAPCGESLILFPGVVEKLTWAESATLRRNQNKVITIDYQPCLRPPAIKLRKQLYRTLEIRDVFRGIIQLETPCDRIAIVAPLDYHACVSEEADLLGIPIFCPLGVEITPYQAHAFSTLLEIIESDYEFQHLKRYLQLQQDFPSLEALLKCKIARGYTILQEKLDRLTQANGPENILKFKQIIEDIEKIRALRETPHEMGRFILERFIRKSYQKNMLRTVLENLAYRRPGISYQAWKTVLAEQLKPIRRIKTNRPNAILLTTEHFPGAFDYLFFMGLQENQFPRQYREDPILPDITRKAINSLTGGSLLTAREQNRRAIRDIKQITASADKAWFGYFLTTDALTGKTLFPSFHLTNVIKAMSESSDISRDTDSIALPRNLSLLIPSSPKQCIDPFEWRLYHLLNQTAGFIGHCMALSETAQKHFAVLNSRFSGCFDQYSGFIDMDGRKKPGKCSCFSTRELQLFMTCPHQWFIEQRLGIRPSAEPPVTDTIAADTIMRILRLTLKAYLENQNVQQNKPVEIIIDEMIDHQSASLNGATPIYVEKLKQNIFTMTQNLIVHLGKYIRGKRKPLFFDLTFGKYCKHDEFTGPVSVFIGGCTFTLNGIIDRIDIADNTAFIIDYKASKAHNYRDAGFQQGHRLQPVLYAEVLKSLTKRGLLEQAPDIKTIYSGFLPLRDNADEFLVRYDDSMQATLQEIIAFIFNAMHQGYFFTTGNCIHCHYTTICGPNIAQSGRIKMKNALKDGALNQLSETYKRFEAI